MTNSDILDNALTKISKHAGRSVNISSEPNELVRLVHKAWKANGGKLAGKPRHSDRFLENALRAQNTPVRSLTPKLKSKTRLQSGDAEALMRVFLSEWPVPGASEGDVEYKPFLSDDEIDAVAAFVWEATEEASEPSAIGVPQNPASILPGEDIGTLIVRLFEESDALITISPEHTLIIQPKTELIGFRNLMNNLMAVELEGDKKQRPLIWVLDIGDQLFEDIDARRKYLNAQSLISRFKALKSFEERGSKQRWDWLKSRVVIILLDTVRRVDEGRGAARNAMTRPKFSSNDLTLNAVAPDWLATSEFRALYGRNLEELYQRSFSVFFNACAMWKESKWERADLRYFGYASFDDNGQTVGRGVELPPLPYRYTEGFRAVALAAAHTLNLEYQMPEHQTPEEKLSGQALVDQMHYLGFRILRLEDFLSEY
jgi:hypothetical protein